MRVAIIQAQVDMLPDSSKWAELASQISDAGPDVLITNEMPFGPWLAESNQFDRQEADQAVGYGEAGIEALKALGIQVILSSRPVREGERLANEAFALVAGV